MHTCQRAVWPVTPPAVPPLIVDKPWMGVECQMDHHPILQSLAKNHLTGIVLIVGALNKMILILVRHTTAPLVTEQHSVTVLLITTITVCIVSILIVFFLFRVHPRWVACPQAPRNLWMLQVSVHHCHLQTFSPFPPLWDHSYILLQSSFALPM